VFLSFERSLTLRGPTVNIEALLDASHPCAPLVASLGVITSLRVVERPELLSRANDGGSFAEVDDASESL
jgi:hypothetical protein